MNAPAPLARRGHSTADVIVMSLFAAVTVLTGIWTVFVFLIVKIETDTCSVTSCTIGGVVDLACVITWAGVAVAIVLTGIGVVRAASLRHRTTWPWPAAGLVLTIGTSIASLALLGVLFP